MDGFILAKFLTTTGDYNTNLNNMELGKTALEPVRAWPIHRHGPF